MEIRTGIFGRRSGFRGVVQALWVLCLVCLMMSTSGVEGHQEGVQVVLRTPDKSAMKLSTQPQDHVFTLRHVLHHGTYRNPGLLRRLDIRPDSNGVSYTQLSQLPALTARSSPKDMRRLEDRRPETIETYLHHSRHNTLHLLSEPQVWADEEVSQPNITDKHTVITLAKMTADAYIQVPNTEDWQEVGIPWNVSQDFGWELDGLRGHIFMDQTNTTIVIGLKGTSPAVFDGAETTTNDKINDNLLFSCCCARVSALWKTVCDCYTGTYSCSNTCLKEALVQENRYYRAALNLYYNVTHMYPDKQIWVTGHSLGGSVSSLLGLTYGLPVVTFEAPGEDMASKRIGIPEPPGGRSGAALTGSYHFGHNSDPLYMGFCNGVSSLCSVGGYAMESKCHTGNVCLYDTVNDFGWRPGLSYHKIKLVITDVLMKYDNVAECIPEDEECTDCFNWKFHKGNGSSTSTTTTTSQTTTTRTTTCQHPGWWGCLDDSTTTTTTSQSTTTTTTTTTTTCSKYGWFGQCLDEPEPPITAAPTATITSLPIATSTKSSVSPPRGQPSSSTSCATPAWFWGCRDKIAPSTTVTDSTTTMSVTSTTSI